jgi:Sulfotransferase family
VLQLLQWRVPPRRWVLKYPNHMLAIGDIRVVYPDAVCVATHRDPVQTLASLCALTEQYRAARYDAADRPALGREMLHFVTTHIDRFMAYRDTVGDDGIIDVDYYRLVGDPVSTVAEIYHRTEMTMPGAVRTRLAVWTEANPKGRRGRYEYHLDDYGLNADELSAVFADYRTRFGVKLES